MKKFKEFLSEMDKGPLSKKTHSPTECAHKHGVSRSVIDKQLNIGVAIEREHTNSDSAAREIALDHLWEIPDYYSRLKKMESSAEKN